MVQVITTITCDCYNNSSTKQLRWRSWREDATPSSRAWWFIYKEKGVHVL